MSPKEVTSRFIYSLNAILEVKVRNFLRKSIFLYLIASYLFMSGVSQIKEVDNKVLLFFAIYISVLVMGVAVVIISAYIQFNRRKDVGLIISFTEDRIIVTDEFTGITTKKDWNWIRQVQLLKGTYYFDIKDKKEVIILRTNNLSEAENTALEAWIIEKRKLIV
jgi:hypothetical protein